MKTTKKCMKYRFIWLILSSMAFSVLFLRLTSLNILGAIILFGILLFFSFYKFNNDKCRYDIIHYLISVILSVSGVVFFYKTWIPSGKLNMIASSVGISQKYLLLFIAVIISVIGFYSVLNTVRIALKLITDEGKKIYVDLIDVFIGKKSLIPITALVFVLVNLIYLIYGNSSPDAYIEGYDVYWNADVALSSGRWAVRFINLLTNNVIIRQLNFLLLYVSSFISGCIIIKLFNIENKIFQLLTIICIFATPSVIVQCSVSYMQSVYAVDLLFATMSAYFIIKGKPVAGAVLLSVSLGCYQSYIGFAACLIFLYLLNDLQNENTSYIELIKHFFKYLASGILGCVMYYAVLLINMSYFHVGLSDYGGANSIGVANSLQKIGPSFKEAYRAFGAFYFDGKMLSILYALLFVLVFVLVLLKQTKPVRKIIAVCFLALLPIIMNFIIFIAPDHEVNDIMSHQCIIILPYLFCLTDNQSVIAVKRNMTRISACVCVIICFIYGIKAYCTQYSLNYAQKYGDFYATTVISSVINDDKYSDGDRILFAGVLDEKIIHKDNRVYKYSSYKINSIAWDTRFGVLTCWQNYITGRLGFNPGKITEEEYDKIIRSKEFEQMNCFPNNNSIEKFGDIYVVKVEKNPPQE